ncbi:MAG: molybdopterin-dependent oxidoreductase [Thermoleophilia bacterium]|nr:molybdopterin-dependent oxidoreductase [Thermoleophilia bacterium]
MEPDEEPARRRLTRPAEVAAWERPIGRRAFLATVAAGVGGLALLSRSSGITRAVSKVTEAASGDGGWRIYAVESPMPEFDPASFSLKISGAVEEPIELTWPEVEEWAGARRTADFHCVTGWSVMDVKWDGILPADIVARVRPKPEAKYVSMLSLETSYMDQVTMEQFLHDSNVLAHSMDGAPLTREHGSPLRMVLPEMYGYKGVKWLRELRFDTELIPGYWERRGYDIDAYVGNSNGIS